MKNTEYHEAFISEDSHWWFITRDRLALKLIAQFSQIRSSGIDLFDIGCGTGGFLSRCSNHDIVGRCSGCEPNDTGFNYSLLRGLNVFQGGFEDLHRTQNTFDVVTCLDVLYHQNVEVDLALQSIRPLLRDDGLLVINVPAIPSLAGNHDIQVEGARRFLKLQLRQLLQNNQYKIENLQYWNTFLAPVIWLVRFMQRTFPTLSRKHMTSEVKLPSKFLNQCLLNLLCIEDQVGSNINFPFGCSLLAAARKVSDE